jgi:hypothetical protein
MRAYSYKRSSGFRASSKKQNGHWSKDSRRDRGDGSGGSGESGESGISSSDLKSFSSRYRAASVAAVGPPLFQLNGFPR